MTFTYAITLESATVPPRTARGTIVATGAGTAARRAFQDAKRKLPGARWNSLVIVLEKEDTPDAKEG